MKDENEIVNVERIIGLILRIGVGVSATIILLGFILLLFQGDMTATASTMSFTEILRGVVKFQANSVIMFGLFCLILTPVLRVIASVYAFWKEHDFLYMWITIIVLIILLIGMAVGFTGH